MACEKPAGASERADPPPEGSLGDGHRHPAPAVDRSAVVVAVTGSVVVLAGMGLGALSYDGATPAEPAPAQVLFSVALGAIVAAPGGLALLSLRGRPLLLAAAAMLLVPLSMTSLAGVALPLLLPATVLALAYYRRRRPGPGWLTAAGVIMIAALIIAAGVALLIHPDPRVVTTAGGETYGTSDLVTVGESLTSLGLVAVAIGGGWWVAGRRSASSE